MLLKGEPLTQNVLASTKNIILTSLANWFPCLQQKGEGGRGGGQRDEEEAHTLCRVRYNNRCLYILLDCNLL